MELKELADYARERYHMEEEHKWADFPGFSVLCHPDTGKWVALLMRQWDHDSGREIQGCELKCGSDSLLREPGDYLGSAIRMRGREWIHIAFDERTESETVFRLFDRAVALGKPHGVLIELDHRVSMEKDLHVSMEKDLHQRGEPFAGRDRQNQGYTDTALPFAGSPYRAAREEAPERIRQMRRLYDYSSPSEAARAENFCRQAAFMADYEDDVPWTGDFMLFFPTYRDLNLRQLRGYFTWRTRLRRGDVRPIPASVAYIYVYELLNGVGAKTPEESLKKLRDFEHAFLDSGIGEEKMRPNLRRWMLEFAVLKDLPTELAAECADPELMERDRALEALRRSEAHSDGEVLEALRFFSGKKLESSQVLKSDPEGGKRLYAACGRSACAYREGERDLFTLCFGQKTAKPWYPLSNAVYHERSRPRDRDYYLNACRSYRCRGGKWQELSYEKRYEKALLQGFLHETEARLRRCRKAGRPLKENPGDAWAIPYIDAVIEEERRAVLEASRPKITIDLGGLERIRREAETTRESLLTEEERAEESKVLEGPMVPEAPEVPEAPAVSPAGAAEERPELPLDGLQVRVLLALLHGQDPGPMLLEAHRMPTLTADEINEALFDEFGDTVLLCDEDKLLLVDDYIEDLENYLGGTSHGRT